jgi:hypothetical protein
MRATFAVYNTDFAITQIPAIGAGQCGYVALIIIVHFNKLIILL